MAVAFDGRGTARMNKVELAAALTDFNRAIELDSKLSSAYVNRGLILLLQGKQAEAEADFKHAIEANPAIKPEMESRIEAVRRLRKVNTPVVKPGP